MQRLGTFFLGMVAGAVGVVMFIFRHGRKLEQQKAERIEAVMTNVFDPDGNPIPPDDPRYKEAMELAKRVINQQGNDEHEENSGDN